MGGQYSYTNDDWFMVEELLNCLQTTISSLSPLEEDRFLLLVEKNFSGKLNAMDFWQKVSGERTFLGSGKRGTLKVQGTLKFSSVAEEPEGGGGICGCFKKKK